LSEQTQPQRVYTPLDAGGRFIRDMSFPHQVARRLSLECGLPIANFHPRVGKHRLSPRPGLKPQQVELLEQAEAHQAFVLTRTKALTASPWAIIFPQELPNDELWQHVMAELGARQLLPKEGE